MKANFHKVSELAESYISGNIGYVKSKVKGMNKLEFVLLCSEIANLKDNMDIDEIAFRLS